MPFANRSALIVGLAQPYVDWAAGLDEDRDGPSVGSDKTVYLIPDFEDDEDGEDVLELVYEEIFERELFAWCTDESTWPADRTLGMFKHWFDLELVAAVEDVISEELEDIEAFEEYIEFSDDFDDEEDEDDRHDDARPRSH